MALLHGALMKYHTHIVTLVFCVYLNYFQAFSRLFVRFFFTCLVNFWPLLLWIVAKDSLISAKKRLMFLFSLFFCLIPDFYKDEQQTSQKDGNKDIDQNKDNSDELSDFDACASRDSLFTNKERPRWVLVQKNSPSIRPLNHSLPNTKQCSIFLWYFHEMDKVW